MTRRQPAEPTLRISPAQELPAYIAAPASPPAPAEQANENPDDADEEAGSPEPAVGTDSHAAASVRDERTRDEQTSQDAIRRDLRTGTEPSANDEGPSLVAPLILGGVGVAALVTGTVMKALASDTHDDLLRLCPNKDCSQANATTVERLRKLQDRGDTYVTLSFVFFAASVLSIGVGAGLYLSEVLDDDSHAPTRAKLQCGPDRCVATLRGHF